MRRRRRPRRPSLAYQREPVKDVGIVTRPDPTYRDSPNADSGRRYESCDTEEAARLTGVNAGTLRYWRSTNQGPPWFRLGPRKIAYLRSDLERWLRDQIDATYVNPEKASPNGSSGT